jgi:SnoaL-like domain
MAQPTPAQRMEHVIRASLQACTDADANAMAACVGPEAVHYSPAGPPWVGAAIIGHHVAPRVREQGHGWTVDQRVIDVDRCAATLEWTRFNRQHARIFRGVDWFVFEPQTFRMHEVRPDTAAPIHPDMARQA